MIRLEAGMPTSSFCRMLGIPERSYRRWQARARQQRNPLGPWPRPVSVRVEAQVGRLDHGLAVSDSTAYRVLDRAGLCLPVDYTRERRDLAAARRAAFVEPPTRPYQVWQLDFTEYETRQGGVWRAAGCADYWSKYEYGWQISTTRNQHDTINAVEIATREAERLSGRPPAETFVDPVTGEITPIRLVTDNGSAFKSHGFARDLTSRPELARIRTRRELAPPNSRAVRSLHTGTPAVSTSARSALWVVAAERPLPGAHGHVTVATSARGPGQRDAPPGPRATRLTAPTGPCC